MDLKEKIKEDLKSITKDLTGQDIDPQITIPQDQSKGDYSTNIAMRLGNPMDTAQKIKDKLEEDMPDYLDRAEVVAPGFINLFVAHDYLGTQLQSLIKETKKAPVPEGAKKVVLEFGDPNPFKEIHIGHLRNLTLGESYARLLEETGENVLRVNYQGDVGLHVAKALWGMQKIELTGETLEAKAKYLGEAYALGAKAYEDDEKAKQEIQDINVKLYRKQAELRELWEKGRKWSLEYFEEIYKRLGVQYDKYYFESETAPVGEKIVRENVGKVFEEHDGAVIFRGEKFGFHTRVFITKENYPTYETKDLALAKMKFDDFHYALSVIITANEQTEYFKVVLKALELIDKNLAQKTTHFSFGFVNLKGGKMSSRAGNVVPANWLIDETRKRLKNQFKDVSEDVLEAVAVGSVKFSMLKFSRESNISFSIEESIQIEGNSAPYLQYTHARTQSLLKKANGGVSEAKFPKSPEAEELALLRLLCHFDETILDAKNTFSSNILCNYLYAVSQKYNLFYQKHKVLESGQKDFRLALTKATGNVLKKGLYLLGIEAPQKI